MRPSVNVFIKAYTHMTCIRSMSILFIHNYKLQLRRRQVYEDAHGCDAIRNVKHFDPRGKWIFLITIEYYSIIIKCYILSLTSRCVIRSDRLPIRRSNQLVVRHEAVLDSYTYYYIQIIFPHFIQRK